jgi:hypothetical protein
MKTIVTKHDELVRKYIQKKYQEETKKNLRTMLKTKQGRWFFTYILEMSGYVAETFTGNSHTFYNEGRRSIGIELTRNIMDMLGKEGFNAKQKAEKEFADFQYKQKRLMGEEDNHE